ncbi:DUF3592 domain-containing protein [Cellulophaga sp. E16_2]|uniref:DUF3592 domain-containing protein n=1 Tax=unclassified Cellulophaga TaxID=2634405 RepID=UPI0013FD7B23|nr:MULTISPECIES: DUF3592 domain-containing protein [unclassified Cellulophaga]MBO0593956.1 DUF3592 domain-containing protein [Cellulophaga sp. E16_2]
MKGNNEGKGCLILFASPFILIGLVTLCLSIINFYNSEKTTNWLKTSAQVKSLEFHLENEDGAESNEVIITYEYIIDNKKYKNNKIAYGYGMNGVDNHHALYLKLKDSKKIIAYVNPANNSDSILIKGINGSIIGLLIFSIMWNSALSLFLVPISMKNNSKLVFKKLIIVTIVIWIIGIILIVTKSIQIPLENKIEVLETKIDTNV